MIKLTVLYNLPPGADHEEFVKWRTESHQKSTVEQMPGLLKTDFFSFNSGFTAAPVPDGHIRIE